MVGSVNRFQKRVRSHFNQNLINSGVNIPAGIYLGEVTQTSRDDPDGFGRVKVHVFRLFPAIVPQGGNAGEPELGSIWCQRMFPPVGGTGGGSSSSVTHGFGGPSPEVGNTVIVGYTGDYNSGIVLGVLPDLVRREGSTTGGAVAENPEGVAATFEPDEQGERTQRPIAPGSADDLLQNDTLRGRPRFYESNIGFFTQNGSGIVATDGDPEDNTGSGVRLRTAQGSQIILDDRTGTIYMNNRSGTGWMEMNNNGDVDIYCQGTFSVRAVGGFNFHTDNNISAQADEGIYLKSLGGGGIKLQAAGGNVDMTSLNDFRITAQGGELHVNTGGNILLSSRANIHLNGPTADRADIPTPANQLGNTGITESVSGRVPEAEPWRGHLDFSPDADAYGGGGGGAGTAGGGAGGGGNYSTAPGAGVDPSRAGNQYPPIAEDASDNVFWDENVDRRISPDLFSAIENIARDYGRPLRITKGYIEPSRAGGTSAADNSMHMTGEAVDVVHAQGNPEMTIAMVEELIELARSNGIGGIGVYNGRRPDAPFANKLHFDLGNERIWGECDNGTLQYECLPTALQDYAEEQDYDPEVPSEPSSSITPSATTPPGERPEWATDGQWQRINDNNPGQADQIVAAIEQQAAILGVHPSAVAGIIDTESRFDPDANTGSYYGATQIGRLTFTEAGGRLGGLTHDEYIDADLATQISVYSHYLTHYGFQNNAVGQTIGNQNIPTQAALLQGMQFAPNGNTQYVPSNRAWQDAYTQGNYDAYTSTRSDGTYSPQASFLGSTSLNDMIQYYSGTLRF